MNEENKEQDLIKQAKEAAERLKAENDRTQELLEQARSEEMTKILSGKSEANNAEQPKEKTRDDIITEKCNEMLKGTGKQI